MDKKRGSQGGRASRPEDGTGGSLAQRRSRRMTVGRSPEGRVVRGGCSEPPGPLRSLTRRSVKASPHHNQVRSVQAVTWAPPPGSGWHSWLHSEQKTQKTDRRGNDRSRVLENTAPTMKAQIETQVC